MERPTKCITVKKAKEMQDNWVNSRAIAIEGALGYEDTREFVFSISELQEYLDYVREKSREQGINNPGIRIYLASYPSTDGDKSLSTVFLSPTKGGSFAFNTEDGEDDNNYDIDPLNDANSGMPPKDYNP